MTERFKVHITSDDAVAVAKKLDAADIPHIGPSFAKFVDTPGGWTPGDDLTAVINASDSDAAVFEVEAVIDSTGDVVAVGPYGSTAGS